MPLQVRQFLVQNAERPRLGRRKLGGRLIGAPQPEAHRRRCVLGEPGGRTLRARLQAAAGIAMLSAGQSQFLHQRGHRRGHVAVADLDQVAQMAKRHLRRHRRRRGGNLRELVHAAVPRAPLGAHLRRSVVDPLGLIVVLVDLQHVQVEGDHELGVGPRAGVQVAHHLRLIDREHLLDGDRVARRGGDAPGAPLDPDVAVQKGHRRLVTVYRARDRAAGVERAAGDQVVLAGRLEVYLLERPAHRPVDAPQQLGGAGAGQVQLPLGAVHIAIGHDVGAVPVENRGVVGAVPLRVDGDRPVVVAQRPLAMAVEDVADLRTRGQGGTHAVRVAARPVTLRLVEVLRRDAQPRQHLLQVVLEAGGKAGGGAERIGHVDHRLAQVARQLLLPRQIGRHLAEYVVVVPRVDEAHLLAALLQRARHQFGRHHLAQVAEMHRARGRHAGGDHVALAVAALADDALRGDVRPVVRERSGAGAGRGRYSCGHLPPSIGKGPLARQMRGMRAAPPGYAT